MQGARRAAGILMAALMVVAVFTGCKAKTAKEYKVGLNNFGQGVFVLDILELEGKYFNETLGNSFMAVNDEFTADKIQTDIQNMISSGVNGILFFGPVSTMVPVISDMCQAAKVPFAMFDQIPTDEAVLAKLFANPYFVGAVGANSYQAAYNMGVHAATVDKKTKAILIGGALGDPAHDARIKGFTEAFSANGGAVIGVQRCSDPSEAVNKADDLIAAHPDADCAYGCTGDFANGVVTALANHKGSKMATYCSEVEKVMLGKVASGEAAAADGGGYISAGFAAVLLQNYLDGHKILDASGKAPIFTNLVNFIITTENADKYQKYFIDSHPYSADQYKNMCYRYNSKVDYKFMYDCISNYTLDNILASHK